MKMDFYKSLVPQIEIFVTIGRTINLEKTARYGKFSKEYYENAAVCLLHPNDMKRLGIKEGNIKITTKNGSVVVKAVSNEFETTEGVIVVPSGPWAKKLLGVEDFERDEVIFKANIESTKEQISSIREIISELKERV